MSRQPAIAGLHAAEVIPQAEHGISRERISRGAARVLADLAKAGHAAFLVGGCVRDLLLGTSPKDFDIATDATPQEVRRVFPRSRIIGRRFKIVHVRAAGEIIEVTTFRADHADSKAFQDNRPQRALGGLDAARSTGGRILRDNVWGTISEDAERRDFTVNALYYTLDGDRVFDFCGGLDDLDARCLRMIGDPATRYREDPVRMLRAIRFAAKLDFDLDPGTEEPIGALSHLLLDVSNARLFDETIKLLSAGHGLATYQLLRRHGLARHLFPATAKATRHESSPAAKLVELALRNTDSRIAAGKPVISAFMYAALLWPVLRQLLADSANRPGSLPERVATCGTRALELQYRHTAIPRRIAQMVLEIWTMQASLEGLTKSGFNQVFGLKRFRAAYDFLLLRAASGEDLAHCCQWWTEYQDSAADRQSEMYDALPSGRRRRKGGSKGRSAAQS